MAMRQSERWRKAKKIFDEDRIELDNVADKNRDDAEDRTLLWFEVEGESDTYTVTLVKQNAVTSCTCHFASMRDQKTLCKHQVAAHLWMVECDSRLESI